MIRFGGLRRKSALIADKRNLWVQVISGEGVQQDRSRGRKVGHPIVVRAMLLRAAVGVAMAGLVVGLNMSIARAGNDDNPDPGSAWNKVMQKLGLSAPPGGDTDSYMERPPLVVPPTRDLPPPATAGPPPVADWPQDAGKPRKNRKGKPEIVPATAVQTPNPPFVKKPWYDPTSWFDKEEYANFNGEPVRENLTDPPAGYRIPSPDQPYGISPDKKPGATKTAGDGTVIQTGNQAAAPAAAQPAPAVPPATAQPAPATAAQPGPPTPLQPGNPAGR